MAKNKSINNTKSEGTVKYADPRDAFLSTKKEMVIIETDIPANLIYKNASERDKIVIAEDSKGFYFTCKNIVGQPILDPYRQYNRISVNKTDSGFTTTVNDVTYFFE